MLYVLLMFKVICIISGNYVLGPVWAVHIEFKKKELKNKLQNVLWFISR